MANPPLRTTYEHFTAQAAPARDALLALGRAAEASGVDKSLLELVRLRASQINGCAFCLQHHLTIARKLGIPAAKTDLVAAWRDAGVFTDREKAALAWTETLTRLADSHIDDAAHAALLDHFTPDEAMHLTVAIGTINQWNRIAVALGFPPAIQSAAQ